MKSILIHFIGLLFLIGSSITTHAQWDTTWTKTYGGNRDDKSFDMIQTNDLGFLLIGSTSSFGFDNSQMYFLKLDSTGAIMWSKSYGGENQESGQSVIQTSDGGYFGVGYSNSTGAGGFDFFMVKLDSNGNFEYQDTYGGADWDFAWDVIEYSNNTYIIAGETQSFGAGESDGWIVKYDGTTQSVLWDKTIGNSQLDNFKSITLGNSGNFIAAGAGIQPGRNDQDVMVSKFNSLGDTIWNKYYGDSLTDFANDIIHMSSNNNFSLTGVKTLSIDTPLINVLQINPMGSIVFKDQWGIGIMNSSGSKIMEIDSHRIAILGIYQYSNKNIDFKFGYSFPYGGSYQEGSTLGGDDKEIGYGAVFVGEQGFVMTGTTNGYNSSFSNIITYKTDYNGDRYDLNSYLHNEDTSNVTSIINIKLPTKQINYNTVTNSITLSKNSDIIHYKIYDITGKLMEQQHLKKGEVLVINTLNIPLGINFFYYWDNDNNPSKTIKIIRTAF